MKKLLFFIILCSLFSCSTETQEEQPVVTGKNFALSLYSTDSIYQSGIDSLFLFYFPESSTPVKPIYFQQELAWGDPVAFQDLEPEPHTFITVACSGSLEELKDLHMELHRNYIRINRHDNVSVHLYYDSLFGFSRRVERSYGLLSGLHRDRKTRKYIR